MSARQHALSTLAIGCLQDCILPRAIHKENSNMIKIEFFTDQTSNQRQQDMKTLFTRNEARNLADRLKLLCAAFAQQTSHLQICRAFRDAPLQAAERLFKTVRHTVERNRQRVNFIT